MSKTHHLFAALPIAALLAGLTAVPLLAQSEQPSEFDLLKPGMDSSLTWMDFGKLATEAASTKKPVMVYFYFGQKTNKNAGEMISAQLRLFPDEEVKPATANFLCAKVDLEKPGEYNAKGSPRHKPAKEKEGAAEEVKEPGLIVPVTSWPDVVCLMFLDYQGRPLERLDNIPSSGKKFATLLKKLEAGNAARIKADEKAAEKAAKEKAKAEEKEKAKAEKEKAKAEAEGAEEGGEGGEGEGDGGEEDGGDR